MTLKPIYSRDTLFTWLITRKGTDDQLARYREQVALYDVWGVNTPEELDRVLAKQAKQEQEKQDKKAVGIGQLDLILEFPGAAIPQPEAQPDPVVDAWPKNILVWWYVGLRSSEHNQGGAWRLWTYGKNIDNGAGVVKRADLEAFVKSLGVNDRRWRRWLGAAKSIKLIREARSGQALRLASLEKAALILGCDSVGNKPVILPADKLAGQGWRSYVWAGALAALHCKDRKVKGGELVQTWEPISRDTLAQLTGVPETTQRLLEHNLDLEKVKSFALTDHPGDQLEVYRKYHEKRNSFLRAVKGGAKFIAYRLPDTRLVPGNIAKPANSGNVRKVNARLALRPAWPFMGCTSPGGMSVTYGSRGQPSRARPGASTGAARLFHDTPKAADKTARRLGRDDRRDITELFYADKPSTGGARWWHVDALLVPYQ